MNNDNIVKIGTALKWRNTFDITRKYYQENIVTVCGCVFRCKVLQAQGKSPVLFTDKDGHMVYTNTDVWDVVVDMAYYYNFAYDTKQLTKETLDYAKQLNEAFNKQQKEIEAIQSDDLKQWEAIHAIEKTNDEQQRELNAINDTISCFSEGIWIDTLLWSNETLWDNNKYAITDDLQNQINNLTETHNSDMELMSDRHNQDIASISTHIIQQEKIQNDVNTYLTEQTYSINNALSCFGSGIWENDLHWGNADLWNNNKYAAIEELTGKLADITKEHLNDVAIIREQINRYKTEFDK